LCLLIGQNPQNLMAGRLCLGGHDRKFLPQQGIHQGAFSGVRTAHDGHVSTAKFW